MAKTCVTAAEVRKAIEEKIFRSNRIEKIIQEMIEEETILIDTTGEVLGQVNGISVLPLGDYSFGKPSRITARTFVGSKGILNIDRETELGGPIHNKGSLILAGYLGGRYAEDIPLAFSASITFEQLYDGVEGDSRLFLGALCPPVQPFRFSDPSGPGGYRFGESARRGTGHRRGQ